MSGNSGVPKPLTGMALQVLHQKNLPGQELATAANGGLQ
jgi:hypothetical protein